MSERLGGGPAWPRCFSLIGALASWSYAAGGFVFTLVQTTGDGDQSLEVLRQYLARWGTFAPIAYVLLVIVEVLVAPLPGTLLYAPGGAIFGGFLGGSLSLTGNVVGAGLACVIARFWGEPLTRSLDSARLMSNQETRWLLEGCGSSSCSD